MRVEVYYEQPEAVVWGRPTRTLLCNLILAIYYRQCDMEKGYGGISRHTLKEQAAKLDIYKYPVLMMREQYAYGRPSDFSLSDESLEAYESFKIRALTMTLSLIELLNRGSQFSGETTAELIYVYNRLVDGLSSDYWP